MKLNFKYINKKMLAGIMVGAVAFSIAGCGCEAKSNYVEISEGVYELSNSIDFSELKDYQLVEMKVDNKVDLYGNRIKTIINIFLSQSTIYK